MTTFTKATCFIAAAAIFLAGCGSADTDAAPGNGQASAPPGDPKMVEYQAEVVGADSVTVEFTTDSGTVSENLPPTSTDDTRVKLTTESGAMIDSQHGFIGWTSAQYPLGEGQSPAITITANGRAAIATCRIKINDKSAGVAGNAAAYDAAQEPYKSTKAQRGVAVATCPVPTN
ncbi:hypothetical protein [Gordonia sp. KTR9]|uniref:hypothetical protein n=1 Tax=Gordonia sp. KTR9 TaxID=337191 RepID=UPI00027DE38C|nr:hypothetical protein [Gordonia sp. KTR9]AFR51421.1 hypothetical protein KTR9_4962 [Gordonia sp. KTR9]